jgi:peptidoglycan hydrolase-like protein with peptidoglycan-binding domain
MSRIALAAVLMFGVGCAHEPPAPGEPGAQRPLPPAEPKTPPDSRAQLAQALRDKGFLAADAPPGTQLGASIRQFQKSQGLAETGFADRETLRRLGIDPDTVDTSLDWKSKNLEGTTGAGVSH